MSSNRPITAAGLVVWRGSEVLLIRRSKPPYAGEWSIPGGKIGFGETTEDAALREVKEETGITAEITKLIGVYESITEHGHFIMVDYCARWAGGEPRAGDDAVDAEFVSLDEALKRVSWDKTRTAIADSAAMTPDFPVKTRS